MKEFKDIPVIMLTAKSQSADKLRGFSLGIDDYVTKPFGSEELVARVRSALRTVLYQAHDSELPTGKFQTGDLLIDYEARRVFIGDEEIKLTPIEFDILYLLASNPGRVFSTDEIFEKVWNEKVYEANNTVMVHIRRLRGKMKEDTRQDKIITTVWGVGYKIEK